LYLIIRTKKVDADVVKVFIFEEIKIYEISLIFDTYIRFISKLDNK